MQVSFFVEVKTYLMYLLCLILSVILKGLRTIFSVVCLLERVTPTSSCDLFHLREKMYFFDVINEVVEIRQTILTFYFFGRQQVAFKGKICWQIQRYLDEIETNVIRRELPDFIFKQRFTTISNENCMIFCVIYLLKRQFAAAVFGTECLIGSKLTVTVVHF